MRRLSCAPFMAWTSEHWRRGMSSSLERFRVGRLTLLESTLRTTYEGIEKAIKRNISVQLKRDGGHVYGPGRRDEACSTWGRLLLRSTIFPLEQSFFSREKKERASTRKDPGEAGSKSERSEFVELQLSFEIESFALLCICAVDTYQ